MNAEKTRPEAAAALMAQAHLSFRTRIGHLALLHLSVGMSAAVISLLATEQELPARTAAAFAALLLINLCWAAYAAWVLVARRTLLFNHRVIAGRIAVGATTVFTTGSAFIAFTTGMKAAAFAALLGLGMLAVAVVLLIRAKRTYAALRNRRSRLEARLAETTR